MKADKSLGGIAKADAYTPLNSAQKGVYFECAENPDSLAYNINFYFEFSKRIDVNRFAQAVQVATKKHPAFFVCIKMINGEPVMCDSRDAAEQEVLVSIKEIAGEAEFAEEIRGFAGAFDLENGPLYRYEICCSPEKNYFIFDMHHLISDGSSLGVFFRNIAVAYEDRDIPDELMTLAEQALLDGELAGSEQYREAQEFFKNELSEVEFSNDIISDVPDKIYGRDESALISIPAPEGLTIEAVEAFAKEKGVSAATFFTAAFAYTLSKFAGEDACFTTGTAARYGLPLEETVGLFVKMVPLHYAINEDERISDFLPRVQKTFHQSIKKSCIDFTELVTKYGVNMDITFLYQSDLYSGFKLDGETVTVTEIDKANYPGNASIMIIKEAGGYRLNINYRKNMFTESLMKGFADAMYIAAADMLTAKKLGDIRLTSEASLGLYDHINNTTAPLEYKIPLDLFGEALSGIDMEKPAIVSEEMTFTYAQLESFSAKIATYISAKGLYEDDFIPILGERTSITAACSWGALRAGTAVMFLDPTYPAERLNFMVSDAGAKLVIADRKLIGLLDEYQGEVLYFDEIDALSVGSFPDPADISPSAAGAIIYTSGTTGRAKGVVLERRNLAAFAQMDRKNEHITSSSRLACYASFGFDAGIKDILTTLLTGATNYIVPDSIRLDLQSVEEFYCRHQITHGFMTTQVARMFAQQTKCKSLEFIECGGEKMVPFAPPKGLIFENSYGPCESLCYVCSHVVTSDSTLQPIGLPRENSKLYVVDAQGRLLSAGMPGELCISSYQLGRGYLGLPEKTKDAFVQNPFSDEAGFERMYKTGDIVRLLPTGEIDFVGRRDGQVKIRGYRVELTEVEEIIRRFAGVKDATVAAFDDAAGGKFIAGYVTGDAPIDIKALHDFIRAKKPSYMVPAVTMQLDAIPYTQNQKVNKRALPVPQKGAADIDMTPPANELEKQIFAMVSEILGTEKFGVNADIFEAGLTSIGMLRLGSELADAYDVKVLISDIKDAGTVKALAQFIEDALKSDEASGAGSGDTAGAANAADGAGANPARAYEKYDRYPLMQNQLGVFVECEREAETTKYNIPQLFKLSVKIDCEKLLDAVNAAINAHSYIKSTLTADASGNIFIERNDEKEPEAEIIEVAGELDSQSLVKPFTLMGGRLYRAQILRCAGDNYLFLDVHHIISDGMSMALFINDINKAYGGETLTAEKFSGFEAALEEEKLLRSKAIDKAALHYEKLLASCNTDCLPAPCKTKGAQIGECEKILYTFDADISSRISAYCKKLGTTENAFFNAVFAYTLSQFIHGDDVTYCTIYNGRYDSRLAKSFAMLVKTLPVRAFISYETAVADFVAAMQEQLVSSMLSDAVSFASLAGKYGLSSDIFFNYQGSNFNFDTIGAEKAEIISLAPQSAKAPITINIYENDGVYTADVDYLTMNFRKEFALVMAKSIEAAALSFCKSERLGEVSIMPADEMAFFDKINATSVPFDNIPVNEVFERVAGALPDKMAVKTIDDELSFSELDGHANKLANKLVSLGVKADDIIGVILDRNIYVPICEIGIMKAGGAFLPMLPTYPDERLDYCMKDASCRFVISTRDIIESRPELFDAAKPYKALDIGEILAETALAETKPNVTFTPNQLAYCIYTSGSTGTPKGVMLEQHNFTNYVQTENIWRSVKGDIVNLCMSSISFDMSITEMLNSLCQGNSIYIASEQEIHDLDMLRNAMDKGGITTLMMTPSFAWTLLSLPEFKEAFARLKGIMLAAEAFLPALFTKIKELNKDIAIYNGYGPTECTQGCSFKEVTDQENITIGGPVANVAFYIFDDNGHFLPRYAVGELMICGEDVCRGYVNLPEKTAAAFTTVNGLPAYHSGDLVRINADGEGEFGGRADNQVKLRGFRIELDEVEAVMQEFDGVSQSKVVVKNDGAEDFLAGYFTADREINISELTAFMGTKLTYYMVPAAMMQLDKMPLTPNGKLDKKALPEIKAAKKERGMAAASSDLEQKIINIFKEVLGLSECYADDNFFEIGGTSLSASKAVMQLKGEGYKAEYQDIFDHQSAQGLAAYLESVSGAKTGAGAGGGGGEGDVKSEKSIDELLSHNALEYADQVERKPLGDVLLTGATGFLGSHVLRDLIEIEEGRIYCLMRKGDYDDIVSRLKATLVYYFEQDYAELFDKRIIPIEGDITQEGLDKLFEGTCIDTIINCAACVKHYAKDNSIEFINVHGVENLIELARGKDARIIQISTTSIPGTHTDETYKNNVKMYENQLFVVDTMNNQYIESKYSAELFIFNAIREGLSGKVIRVGNLMGRYSDGEFQTNMRTNAFMNALRGFVHIGKCPISHATDPMSFSPVDCTSKAIVLLSGTNDMFNAYHVQSRSTFDEMQLIEVVNACGIKIVPVPDKEYYDDFYRMMADQNMNEKVSALLTNDRPDLHMVEADNRFTANILYRLGFSWPFIEDDYLKRAITSLDELDFFS